MAQIDLGSIKFNWKGSYSGATAYVVDDVVESSGSSYVCILASTGNAPPNATYWELMSQKGTDGTDGTDLTTTLTTQGDILYRDGSGLQRLGAGTSGQYLQTGGTGANPSWSSVSGYTDSDALSLFSATGSAPVFAVRAWINFNGTGTVSIRGSGNVSSLTDNGTGNYQVNLTSNMPNTNYSGFATSGGASSGASFTYHGTIHSRATSSFGVNLTAYNIGTNLGDTDTVYAGIVG
jgi:hypothetical protein